MIYRTKQREDETISKSKIQMPNEAQNLKFKEGYEVSGLDFEFWI